MHLIKLLALTAALGVGTIGCSENRRQNERIAALEKDVAAKSEEIAGLNGKLGDLEQAVAEICRRAVDAKCVVDAGKIIAEEKDSEEASDKDSEAK